MRTLALDVGTSLVKAVLFDPAGRPTRVARTAVPVLRPAPGRAEQDMTKVWDAVVSSVRDLGLGPDEVHLVSVTAQGDGCWLVDAAGDPAGPAILWSDGRAQDLVTAWVDEGRLQHGRSRNGLLLFPGSPAAILAWLRHHQPERLAASATATSCSGFVTGRLVGRARIELSDASHPFADLAAGAYDPELVELLDAHGSRHLLPEIVRTVDSLLPITVAAADALGLAPGTPVVQAPYDVPASAIGAGCTDPGASFAILGTALICGTVLEAGAPLDRASTVIALGMDGLLLEFHPTLTGVGALGWAAELMGLADAAEVVELASTTSPGARGALALPYLSPAGERAPFLDPHAPGGLLGLNFDTGRAEVARALVEALSLVVRECLESGPQRGDLHVCGGGSNSDFWCGMLADATARAVLRPDASESGARGAMICARVAVGEFTQLADAATALAVPHEAFEPDSDAAPHFEDLASRLFSARETLR